MVASYKGLYIGDKRCEVEHLDSGSRILTSAPKDNNGDGSTFSPTDLCAASLGTCMMTVIGIVADRLNFSVSGMWFKAEKQMSSDLPRRISSITIDLHLPEDLTPERRELVEKLAWECPVNLSIHPDIRKNINFYYESTSI